MVICPEKCSPIGLHDSGLSNIPRISIPRLDHTQWPEVRGQSHLYAGLRSFLFPGERVETHWKVCNEFGIKNKFPTITTIYMPNLDTASSLYKVTDIYYGLYYDVWENRQTQQNKNNLSLIGEIFFLLTWVKRKPFH